MRVRFVSLGCKVNQYETQALESEFLRRGHVIDDSAKADAAVINSCTVTSLADRKTRQVLRRLRREMPHAVIALTGCMPQAAPDSAAALTEADIITGTRDRARLAELIENFASDRKRVFSVSDFAPSEGFESLNADRFDESFQRAYLKIEDGCDRFCSYCIIPFARGRVRSRPIGDITAETQRLADRGYREIVLTGINISRYGADIGLSLADAVKAAADAAGDFRIRLGSVEPDLISESDWHRLSKIEKLCPHFHLPIQSGCDKTLSRMNRRYTMAEFSAVVSRIRSLFFNPSITADIIVGFPGETDEEFDDTCRSIAAIGLLRAHIFEYSPRAGTKAADMPDQIPPQIKRLRAKRLAEICTESAADFARSQVGKTARVLLEATGGGYADNYLYVNAAADGRHAAGSFIDILLTGADGAVCSGTPINSYRDKERT